LIPILNFCSNNLGALIALFANFEVEFRTKWPQKKKNVIYKLVIELNFAPINQVVKVVVPYRGVYLQTGLAIKNPPKKTKKNHIKKPTRNVFFGFFGFF
jgi:hypothetical protein